MSFQTREKKEVDCRTLKRLQKELAEMESNPREGCWARPVSDDDLFHWKGYITGPEDTPYAGGTFFLDIHFPIEYPFRPMRVRFTTRVYHCGVNSRGYTCSDLLGDNWSPALLLSRHILPILRSYLADSASLSQDPLVPDIAQLYKTDRATHDRTAAEWTLKYATQDQEEDMTVDCREDWIFVDPKQR